MISKTMKQHALRHRRAARVGRRRGSILVVVLALLSALMLLGFLFYTTASQEVANARYYSATHKFPSSSSLDASDLFDFALEQIILGPRDDLSNSALWGGRYSLLASLIGTDLVPYDGAGVNVKDAKLLANDYNNPANGADPRLANGVPAVDQDMNSQADTADVNGDGIDDRLSLQMADWVTGAFPAPTTIVPLPRLSPKQLTYLGLSAAQNGIFPDPDVNYSYPDLDSLFLGYIGQEPLTNKTVVIPSFHRPQYLRGLFGITTHSTWYTNAATLAYSLRPHKTRAVKYFNYRTGQIVKAQNGGGAIPRFAPGFWETTPSNALLVARNPGEGVWDNPTGIGVPRYNGNADGDQTDVDGDGTPDGIYESVLLDLDYPVQESADGTKRFIPMFHVSIYDLDALFNLNAHGNLYGLPNSLAGTLISPDPTSPSISQSNEGRQRHEVNPTYGFTAPTSTATGGEYTAFFGHGPSSWMELANMEFWFVLMGRGEKSATKGIDQLYPGRWGEADKRLKPALITGSSNPYAYPRPGVAGYDESGNWDRFRGLAHRARGLLFPATFAGLPFIFQPGAHPTDQQGQGTYVKNNGATLNLKYLTGALGQRVRILQYAYYWMPNSNVGPIWKDAQIAIGYAPAIIGNVGYGLRSTVAAVGTTLAGLLVDNPGETILNPRKARNQVMDAIFGAEETAALHLSQNDFQSSGMLSRLLHLVPANFSNPNIRKRFTTVSTDLNVYGNAVGQRWSADLRRWENGIVGDGGYEYKVFPPYVGNDINGGTVDENAGNLNRNVWGFRPEARGILQQQGVLPAARGQSQNRAMVKALVRKLSVNQVAALSRPAGDGRPRYVLRPVTPHPVMQSTSINVNEPIPQPTIVDAQGNPRTPASSGGYTGLGDPTIRAQFGMPDSWLVQSGLATWNMANVNYTGMGFVDSAGNAWPKALQEWHARRDRQNLARDIYTLLYMFGHVNPAFHPTSRNSYAINSITTKPWYTNAQLREMAQFAVNVVDAMDPDDTITLFVYDKNLANGYTLRDNGYRDQPDYQQASTSLAKSGVVAAGTYQDDERGLVFGVEMQKLAFSEALAVLAKKFKGTSSPGDGTDNAATSWKDTAHRDFLYVELQSMIPTEVHLDGSWSIVSEPAATSTGGTGGTGGGSGGGATFSAANARTLTPKIALGDPGDIAKPGATYTIGAAGDPSYDGSISGPSSDPSGYYPSQLRVNLGTGTPSSWTDFPTVVTPALADGSQPYDTLDFDAIQAADDQLNVNQYLAPAPWRDGTEITQDVTEPGVTDPTPPKGGAWLFLGTQKNRKKIQAGQVTITLTLRRRANLHRTPPIQDGSHQVQQTDNPWITVDVMKIPLRVFKLKSGTLKTVLEQQIVSTKRPEPLNRSVVLESADPGDPAAGRNMGQYRTNSLGGYHAQDVSSPATIWQRHYDRPFASIAGLLQVPLFGPAQLTSYVYPLGATPTPTNPKPAVVDLTSHAMARFLYPDTEPRRISIAGAPTQVRPNGNLWYRALAFLEVPDKYGNPDGAPWFVSYAGPTPWGNSRMTQWREKPQRRRFGKINLNTLRHPQVLAGLLDDNRIMNIGEVALTGNGSYLPSRNSQAIPTSPFDGTANRDWWITMLASRDGGIDQYSLTAGGPRMILPGVPAASPFRDFSVAPVSDTGTQPPSVSEIYEAFSHTMLRTMPHDQVGPGIPYNPGTVNKGRRSLFTLGNMNSGGPLALGGTVDMAARYRLLSKVLKHGTTRSNTYIIFITCDFYQAFPTMTTSGRTVYQIGAKMPADSGSPGEPRYRGVFIVDRTLAMKLVQPQDLPPIAPGDVYPAGSKYRTFSFDRNKNGKPTFDWRKLISFRKVVKSK